jgi:hypothetical protein
VTAFRILTATKKVFLAFPDGAIAQKQDIEVCTTPECALAGK